MNNQSKIGRRLGANPATARIIIADPGLKAEQKAQDRYRALVAIAGICVLASLGFLLARTTEHLTPSQTRNVVSDDDLFTGTIRTNPDDKMECREQFFDNRSGKMTVPEPCGLRAINAKGQPSSSISLDAIRKSFSKH
jgi:hypothetical protein